MDEGQKSKQVTFRDGLQDVEPSNLFVIKESIKLLSNKITDIQLV